MRVRALKSFAGPGGSYAPGQEFELPEGVDWLRAGFVVPVAALVRAEAWEQVVPSAEQRAALTGKAEALLPPRPSPLLAASLLQADPEVEAASDDDDEEAETLPLVVERRSGRSWLWPFWTGRTH